LGYDSGLVGLRGAVVGAPRGVAGDGESRDDEAHDAYDDQNGSDAGDVDTNDLEADRECEYSAKCYEH
jgi:hypothetical protein